VPVDAVGPVVDAGDLHRVVEHARAPARLVLGGVEEVVPGLQLARDDGLVVDEARGAPRLADGVLVLRIPHAPEVGGVDVLDVGDEVAVELVEQPVLDQLGDEHARRNDDVVAGGALRGDELGDHLLVGAVGVERDARAQLGGEVLEHARVVVVAPGVDRERVLELAAGGDGGGTSAGGRAGGEHHGGADAAGDGEEAASGELAAHEGRGGAAGEDADVVVRGHGGCPLGQGSASTAAASTVAGSGAGRVPAVGGGT